MTQTELETKILQAQEAYYNSDKPLMSDQEFDRLWDELKTNYPDSEVLQNVGGDHIDGFPKAKHLILMGSQSKANTEDEMATFFTKVGKRVLWQHKMDGLSLELNYKQGKLAQAITRGNGEIGDDVTENVKKMNYVPHQLSIPFTGAVRGEMLLSRANKEKYFPQMKNCRNAASGISKHLDGRDCDKLDVVCYDAQHLDGTSFMSQEKLMEWLLAQGFKVAPYEIIETSDAKTAMQILTDVFNKFDELEYDIDGIVWKQDEIDMTDLKTNLRPKTQIALKPARTYAVTKLIGIEWRVRNGTITPIALLEPVDLLGATIRKASLANVSLMEQLGIEIGDKVRICRRGEIIPKVEAKVE